MSMALYNIGKGEGIGVLNPKPEQAMDMRNLLTNLIHEEMREKKENEKGVSSETESDKTRGDIGNRNKEDHEDEAATILNQIINSKGGSDTHKIKETKGTGDKNNKVAKNKNNEKNQEGTKPTDGRSSEGNADKQEENVSNNDGAKVCRYFRNDLCKFGNGCRYRHKELCKNWKTNGKCGSNICKLDHPEPCINHLKGSCKRRSCWYLHTTERNVQKQDMQQDRQQEKPRWEQSKNHNYELGQGVHQRLRDTNRNQY